jgi:hypothetical protein
VSRILIATASLLLAVSVQAVTTLTLPDDAVTPGGESVSVPLSALPASGILGVDMTLEYNAAVLTATGVTKTPISNSFTLTFNTTNPGIVQISLFGGSAMSGSGPIAEIQFDVIGSPGQTSQLDLTFGQINEGAIATALDDGTFTVCAGASPEVLGVALTRTPETTLQWGGQFNAVYDVVGGLVSQLRVDGGIIGALCLADDRDVPSWSDTRPDPAPGSAYYYLIRAEGPCGKGSYGHGFPPTADCP